MKACLIHEFAPHVDYQRQSVYEALQKEYPETRFYSLHGFLSQYIEGGMHPLRLLNMVWVFLKIPFHLLLVRPSWILCGTAPPGIQVWVSIWAKWLTIPTVAWIFDYHPEIEVNALERQPLLKPIGKFLRWLDHRSQQSLTGIIVLDEAMAKTFLKVNPQASVRIHPTWNQYEGKGDSPPVKDSPLAEVNGNKITLAYAGNLGAKHPLNRLEEFVRKLNELSSEVHIELNVISSNESVRNRFREFSKKLNLELLFHDRVPTLDDLKAKLNELGTDYGIILMEEEAQGLLSPSKYSGYLFSGLPLLYCGPRWTNADKICRELGAGVAISAETSPKEIAAIAEKILEEEVRKSHKSGVSEAYQQYTAYNSSTFLSMLQTIINPSNGSKPENQ